MDLSLFGPRTILAIATVAMLVQQAFAYVCQIVMPVLADRLADDFGISPAWLGLYLFIQNIVSIITAIGCGSFILRYGPMRISQVALLLMGASLMVVASGQLWLFPLGAILLGAAAASTPASSHILARVCAAPGAGDLLGQADRRAGGCPDRRLVDPVPVGSGVL
jgi:MFS family permease